MSGQARTIGVRLGEAERLYDIVIGAGVLRELGERLATLTGGRSAMVVVDDGVPTRLVEVAERSLVDAGFHCVRAMMHASEAEKSLATAGRLIHSLAEARLERTDALVALGGGIVGDVTGFAAASYRRGIQLVQCPTTLLSMVDASVGGKTGVNLMLADGMRKNLAGAFYQPRLVLADVQALDTLPERVLRAGLGECLKHGMISTGIDDGLFAWTLDQLEAICAGDAPARTELVARNVAVKKFYVEGDERETSSDAKRSRMLLNLGHTYAHALESVTNLSPDGDPTHAPLMHGEAVLLGLVAASHAAAAAGMFDAAEAALVRDAVERLGLATRVAGLPGNRAMIERMADDKKAAAGRLRVILPDGPGSARVVENPPKSVLEAGWEAIRVGP